MQLGTQLQYFALGFDQFRPLLFRLVRRDGLHPLVQAMAGDAKPGRNIRNRIATINNLANSFLLELGRISLGTHGLPPMLKS